MNINIQDNKKKYNNKITFLNNAEFEISSFEDFLYINNNFK